MRAEVEAVDGLHVNGRDDFVGEGKAADLDPLPVVIDLAGLPVTGYQAADWLREEHHLDVHISDHRRINTQLTHADDRETTARLLAALRELAARAGQFPASPAVRLRSPADLRMEQTLLPRDAYFGRHEDVPVSEAEGRVAAEMITPYPPGIPTVLPGERLTRTVLDYLRSGVAAGMNLPDAASPDLTTVRAVADGPEALGGG
ncbi:hypothetical protein NR995_03445 [Streptomyces albus]|nr:hypothetical protein NR995_03445 [Streptomyces albus]